MTTKQKNLFLKGEPNLGSIYGEEEISIINKILKESMDPSVGFLAGKEELEFESDFSNLCKCKYAVAVNGGGTALDLILKTLNIKSGDEIISCAINFHGTHLAIIGSGAKLILCEPDPNTLNIDSLDAKKRLTKRTKAIIVTHMNGLAADTELLRKFINDSGLFKYNKKIPKIICDAARACGTTYKGQHIGRYAWATVFSFQSFKTITTLGEGGMIVTNDQLLVNKLRDYRSFGRGKNWGSNYKITKLQAAVGRVQLKKLTKLVEQRRNLAEERHKMLAVYPQINIQKDSPDSLNSYYLYTIILPNNTGGIKRDKLIKILKDDYGIGCVVGNPPTYKTNKFIKLNTKWQSLPLSDNLGNRILCLCIHPAMSKKTNQYIIKSFMKSFEVVFKEDLSVISEFKKG